MGLLFCHLLIIYPGEQRRKVQKERRREKKAETQKEGDTASFQ
jgi:hypothetical protein